MLVAIFAAVTFLMTFAGEIPLTVEQRVDLFMANNGALKLAFFVVLAALYPLFGFVKRTVEGDVVENRDQIIVALETSGFSLQGESEGKIFFRANTILRRTAFLFEDTITVEQRGEMIQIEGVRRGVVYAAYCLSGFIENSKRTQE